MSDLFRWLVEFWIIRFLFRWLFRAAVLVVLVLGVLVISGQYDGLKRRLFASADRAVGTPAAVESAAARAEAIAQPAVDNLKAGVQRDREAIRNAAQAVHASNLRAASTGQATDVQYPDQLQGQLESLRSRDAKSPNDASDGH